MLLLALLVACGESEPPAPKVEEITSAELSAAAAQLVCTAAQAAGATCATTDGAAKVGDHTIMVEANVDSFLVLDGKTVGMGASKQVLPGEVQVGAKVTTKVDGKALLVTEVAGTGSDVDPLKARQAALDGAAQRWGVGAGLAVLDAVTASDTGAGLASVGMNVPPETIGESGLRAWSAYPVLRGRGFDPKLASKMGPSVASMAKALGPFVGGLSADGLHTVEVQAKLGGGGSPGKCGIIPPVSMTPGETVNMVKLEGTVKVDGAATGDICALSETVAWALPKGSAILEWDQTFVLGPAATPAE